MQSFRILFYNKVKKEYKLQATYYRQFDNEEQARDYADTFTYDMFKIIKS